MILTGAAAGRVAPKATVGRKEGWRAGDRKEWEQFSRLNEGFDLSSMSEDTLRGRDLLEKLQPFAAD